MPMTEHIDNCTDCGKLAKLSRALCVHCSKKEYDDLDKVNKFLRRNKHAFLEEIVEQTGVLDYKIRKFIKEGRLIPGTNLLLFDCQICKTPIKIGTLCDPCKTELRINAQKMTHSHNNYTAHTQHAYYGMKKK